MKFTELIAPLVFLIGLPGFAAMIGWQVGRSLRSVWTGLGWGLCLGGLCSILVRVPAIFVIMWLAAGVVILTVQIIRARTGR